MALSKTIDGLVIVKREMDAWAVYDATRKEIIEYAPGQFWGLSKTKALRERGTGNKVYYIGRPDKTE